MCRKACPCQNLSDAASTGDRTLSTKSPTKAPAAPAIPAEIPAPRVRATRSSAKALMPPEAVVQLVLQVIDDAKAEEVVSIDLAGKTSIADAMIVASGRSDRHVGAIAERIASTLKEMGQPTPRIEGMPVCDWVLIDTGDVIVHLFRPEVRSFYNLEKLWGLGRPLEGAGDEPEKPKRVRKVVSDDPEAPVARTRQKTERTPAPRRAPVRKPRAPQ